MGRAGNGGRKELRLRTFAHLGGEALASVWDNSLLSIAAVTTVSISLLVLAIVSLLAINMQHLASVLDAQVQVVAYIQVPAKAPAAAGAAAAAPHAAVITPASARAVGAASSAKAPATPSRAGSVTVPAERRVLREIAALPGVSRVVFVSKAQALHNLSAQFTNARALITQVKTHNPLPDAADVYVGDPRQVAGVAAAIAALPGVTHVQDAQTTVNRLFGFTQALRYVGLFLVAALALTTLVVIGNTVRVTVYARRDQIGIMKLVGATNSFIRFPFFIEGAVLGVLGAVLAGAAVFFGYRWLQGLASVNLPFLPLLTPQALLPRLVEALLVAGLLLGALGSAISVRRHLNV